MNLPETNVNLVTLQQQINEMLQFFEYTHLPKHLQIVSAPFGELAQEMNAKLPLNNEKVVTLRKLLEAKDAAVRTLVIK